MFIVRLHNPQLVLQAFQILILKTYKTFELRKTNITQQKWSEQRQKSSQP